jgi:hypothetical protein
MIKQTGTLNKYSDKQCCIYGLFGRFDNNYVKCGLLVWQESVCCAQREEESTAGDKHNPRKHEVNLQYLNFINYWYFKLVL